MKVLIFFLLSLPLLASNYNFLHYNSNYNHALQKATQEKKLLMLVLVQDYCGWCSKLASETLKDEQTENYIKNSFVPVLLNINHCSLPLKYQTSTLPTIFFINPIDDEEVSRSVGFKNVSSLTKAFREAFKNYQEDLADENE